MLKRKLRKLLAYGYLSEKYIEFRCDSCKESKKKQVFLAKVDNEEVIETIHAYEFIKKLIIHIPEKNFKRIRYFGIYFLLVDI